MTLSPHFLHKWNPLIDAGCSLHDAVSDFLAKYLKQIKWGLLAVAHASLLGLFFPQLARSFGSLAQDILLVILLVSPLSKLFRMKLLYQLMGLRRELGIWFAYAAIVHSTGYFLNPSWFDIYIAPFLAHPLAILPRYIFGIVALILTLPLLLTSNTFSLRVLKGNWKKVHWLVYPLFAAMLLHIFLSRRIGSGIDLAGALQAAFAFGGYIFLKLLAKNNFVAPLRDINAYVGQRYKEYRSPNVRA